LQAAGGQKSAQIGGPRTGGWRAVQGASRQALVEAGEEQREEFQKGSGSFRNRQGSGRLTLEQPPEFLVIPAACSKSDFSTSAFSFGHDALRANARKRSKPHPRSPSLHALIHMQYPNSNVVTGLARSPNIALKLAHYSNTPKFTSASAFASPSSKVFRAATAPKFSSSIMLASLQ
jgi:hypothetical protein